jgi:hypothetical protein
MITNEAPSVDQLNQSLKEMPTLMRNFSRGLRSLYAECAFNGDQSIEDFRKVRDDVRDYAAVYVSEVLPKVLTTVLSIKSFFDYYIALDYKEWEECLDDIVNELGLYEKDCKMLMQMHKKLEVSLKKSEDEALTFIEGMKLLSSQLEEKGKKHERDANIKRMVGYASLAVGGFVGAVVPGAKPIEMVASIGTGVVANMF